MLDPPAHLERQQIAGGGWARGQESKSGQDRGGPRAATLPLPLAFPGMEPSQ